MKRFLLATAASVVALASAGSAQAASIVWTLSNVTFDDGATASGTFTVDSVTGQTTSVNISTTAGLLSAFTYDGMNSQIFSNNLFPNSFLAAHVPNIDRYLNLTFTGLLTAPGSNPLALGIFPNPSSFECNNCNVVRYAISGLATAAVPEPATWAMMIAGFGLVGAAMRRRSIRTTVSYA